MLNKHYLALEGFWQEYYLLDTFESLLRWDEAVVMPPDGSRIRAKQLAYIKKRQHAVLHQANIREHLKYAYDDPSLDPWQKFNLKKFEHLWRRALAVPSSLLEALAASQSLAEKNWREAYDHNKPHLIEENFQKVVGLVKEKAERISQALQITPYEALAQEYDPDFSMAQTEVIFREIESELPNLISIIKGKNLEKFKQFNIKIPIKRQEEICRVLLQELGLTENSIRFDQSRHPFTEAMPADVRLTVKYDEEDFTSALLATLHEGGHALYDLHLPLEHQGSPVGRDAGMSVHEAQGLFWENFVGRNDKFLSWMVEKFPDLSKEQLNISLNNINLNAIRLNCDEVSYLLHIILRFEIEKKLLSQNLSIFDISELWDQLSLKFFGAKPRDYRTGFLQDIHWYLGYIGYFPMYGIGMVLASYLYKISHEENLKYSHDGNIFYPLVNWLDTTLYKKGAFFSPLEIIKPYKHVNLTSSPIFEYFTKKYLT